LEHISNNYKNVNDDDLKNYLLYFSCVYFFADVLIEENADITLEDVLYSRYYWFVMYAKRYKDIFKNDLGFDAQESSLISDIDNYFKNEVDRTLIKNIKEGNLVLS